MSFKLLPMVQLESCLDPYCLHLINLMSKFYVCLCATFCVIFIHHIQTNMHTVAVRSKLDLLGSCTYLCYKLGAPHELGAQSHSN